VGKKLRIGWFTFTCCEDSSIVLVEMMNRHYFEWKEKLDFRYCRFLKSKNVLDSLDVAFVEGAISNEHEKKKLLEVRSKAKYLVAVGSCACTGGPSAQRNDFSPEMKAKIAPFLKRWDLYERVLRLDEVVKVDERVDGCPMFEQRFLDVLAKYLTEFGINGDGSKGAAGKGGAKGQVS
jgi:coenzyme F420-reducing hydrogenase gamma subunit